jgi:lambda family phage portal protein
MGIMDLIREHRERRASAFAPSSQASETVAAVPSPVSVAPASTVQETLPSISGGVSSAQMGFMDGTDGKPGLTWARYQVPVFRAGYGPYVGTPGSEVSRERAVAAAVSADLLTSNSIVATLVENLAVYGVGNGLTLSSRPDHAALGISPEAARELSHRIERAWAAWAGNPAECDASGRHTLHQLATAAFKSWLVTGEAVFLLDWIRGNGAQTATKVKLLDSRQLDQAVNRTEGNGSILQGIRFDSRGHVVGYWIRPFVLGNLVAAPQPVFIKARTSWGRPRAVHLFDLIMPGQVRGLSPLTAALSAAHSKGTLREFALAAALVQTMTATTIESDLPAAQALNAFAVNDGLQQPGGLSPEAWIKARGEFYEAAKVSLQPGAISHLMMGDKIKMHRSESPNATYDAFDKSLGREGAKAAGSSYEDVSGDYSTTSFLASRLAMELPWRINKRRRAAIVEPFYRAVFTAWLEEACETGRIELPQGAPAFFEAVDAYTQSAWRGDGKPVADPYKQALAEALELENGTTTLEALLAERGMDFEESLAQRKAEKQQCEAAGFAYPSSLNRDTLPKPDDEPAETLPPK